MPNASIAIVGAGLAGLTAAWHLNEKGQQVEVFEVTGRVGGRVSTAYLDGAPIELGGGVFDSNHTDLLFLTEHFNLPLIDLDQFRPPQVYHFHGRFYTHAEATREFMRIRRLVAEQFANETLHEALDLMSVDAWIKEYVPGALRSWFGQLLKVAYTIKYGREASEQSALNLVYLLGGQPDRGGFSIFGESNERYRIAEGNQRLPLALAETLPQGTIKFRRRMLAISVIGGRVALDFVTPEGPQRRIFDRVILTLPFSILRKLDYSRANFGSQKVEAITQLPYGNNEKLFAVLQPGTNLPDIFTDLGFQNMWEATLGVPGKHATILTNYVGGDLGAAYNDGTTSKEQHGRRFLAQLEKMYPDISRRVGSFGLTAWRTNPNSLGSYSCYAPGDYTRFGGIEAQAEGPVHFAGEHTSSEHQGFMQGAVESGLRAAEEVLAALNA